MGRKRKRTKKQNNEEPEELKRAPHSFVINKGLVGKNVNNLINDLRTLLEPNTASHLKVKKANSVKDFISVASIFNVTHMICLSKTQKNIFMRFCRIPHGPTIVFKVKNYTLGKDVRSSLRRPLMNQKLFRKSPLLVMNSFVDPNEDKPHLKLITSMFKTMFPFIDISNVKLKTVKRCVMLNYNADTGLIDFRHYAVKVKPVGLSKPVKKLVASKKIPNLSKLKSFDDIMEVEHGFTSESEGELDEVEEQRHVTVTEPMKTGGNVLFEKSAVRCIEIGPRLTLELVSIFDKLEKGSLLANFKSQQSSDEEDENEDEEDENEDENEDEEDENEDEEDENEDEEDKNQEDEGLEVQSDEDSDSD